MKPGLLKIIFKIIFSSIIMSIILQSSLVYFDESLEYISRFKSIYLLFIVSFVATIYLISCYLLGILKTKNYKTN